jgi:hypothetical protein
MEPRDVTLGDPASSFCAREGIDEAEIREARANPDTQWENPEALIVTGTSSNNNRYRMTCAISNPNHVITFRPI